MTALGGKIRQARIDYGMSQKELSKRIRISPQALNNIETGDTLDPGFGIMQRIAATLGVSLDTFSLAYVHSHDATPELAGAPAGESLEVRA